MTNDKLRGWLNVPDGPWPPDHYALIGLPVGAGSPQEIEARVLERLELLRRYQLPPPGEATEGMHLPARALDTLADPDARRRYDRTLGLKPVTRVDLPPGSEDELNTLFPGVPLLTSAADGPTPSDEPIIPDDIN